MPRIVSSLRSEFVVDERSPEPGSECLPPWLYRTSQQASEVYRPGIKQGRGDATKTIGDACNVQAGSVGWGVRGVDHYADPCSGYAGQGTHCGRGPNRARFLYGGQNRLPQRSQGLDDDEP